MAWLLDVVPPDYRLHGVLRRYPVALAANGLGYLVERACLPPFSDLCADIDKSTFLESLDLVSGSALWASPAAPVFGGRGLACCSKEV